MKLWLLRPFDGLDRHACELANAEDGEEKGRIITGVYRAGIVVTLCLLIHGCASSESRDAARRACEHFGGLRSLMFDMTFDLEATCNDGTQIKHARP